MLELYTLFFLWGGLLRKPSPAPCLWGESIVNLSLCCLVALTPRQANLLPAAGDTASLLSLLLRLFPACLSSLGTRVLFLSPRNLRPFWNLLFVI